MVDNLALACQGCNNHKYIAVEAIDPAAGAVAPLFHPRGETWEEHFTWSDGGLQVIGLTPTGRATVARLRLNRRGLVNIRRALRMVGLHPAGPPRPGHE